MSFNVTCDAGLTAWRLLLLQTRLSLSMQAAEGRVLAPGESVRAAIAKGWVKPGVLQALQGLRVRPPAQPCPPGPVFALCQRGEWSGQLLPDLYDKYCE